ncbi:hypothetical protein Mapa_004388 [Marchantia paleacea]|nr:hypothetical protein Mapa_004388 [Marchantia paleacea]
MIKEYRFWIKERDTYTIKVEEEKRITEEMLQAESGKVLELDEEIRRQYQLIISLKAQVVTNVNMNCLLSSFSSIDVSQAHTEVEW